jgi:starvation-inducible DNA-binding protein
MKDLNNIGLDAVKAKDLAEKLNDLLSNYSIFYINTRGYHWNIQGDKFFELHLKFEELYNNLVVKIDDIAERILTLGFTPIHAYSTYIKISTIKEVQNVSQGHEAVSGILSAFNILITKQRDILKISSDLADEGTNALMSDYIREQEKLTWMYSSFLGREK